MSELRSMCTGSYDYAIRSATLPIGLIFTPASLAGLLLSRNASGTDALFEAKEYPNTEFYETVRTYLTRVIAEEEADALASAATPQFGTQAPTESTSDVQFGRRHNDVKGTGT